MIRTLALGAVLAAATATTGMAQGVNNTGYDRYGPYYGNQGYYYNNPGNNRYYGYGERGYGYNRAYPPGPIEGATGRSSAAVWWAPSMATGTDHYGNNYGYGSSYQPGWGSGGGAAYDRGYYRPYDYGYWGR